MNFLCFHWNQIVQRRWYFIPFHLFHVSIDMAFRTFLHQNCDIRRNSILYKVTDGSGQLPGKHWKCHDSVGYMYNRAIMLY